jgi:hypothetical protein
VRLLLKLTFGSLLLGAAAGVAADERAALDSVRRDALAQGSVDTHPLPLAAQWNVGAWPGSFDPGYQVEQIRQGRYLLPTFNLEPPDARPQAAYYTAATRYLAQQKLPLSFISLQWEMVLPRISSAYAGRDAQGAPLPLSPFGPLEPWYAAGRSWGQHPMLKEMQALYPEPPLVLFISNNEQPRQAWSDLKKAPEVIARAGANADDATVRRIVGDAWVERYQELLRGFREALTQTAWREHARFAAYDAFSQQAAGRWWGWVNYSLHTPGQMQPWSRAWGGASVSFYVHDWAPDADDLVWSPQIEAMNWVPVLAEVMRANPDYWFELSTWDGQTPGLPKDKSLFYRARGQTLTPARVAGMAQFGMWLLRPRVIREFRGTEDGRAKFEPYFVETLNAVTRVHDDPTLARFWTTGRLVANPSNVHPYQENLPADFAGSARWFLLDSPVNPARPWRLDTPLELYALALAAGAGASAEWLVYAFSPHHEAMQAQVQIPNGPRVTVPAAAAGCFSLVQAKGAVSTITCGSRTTPARMQGVKVEPGTR